MSRKISKIWWAVRLMVGVGRGALLPTRTWGHPGVAALEGAGAPLEMSSSARA